jgi:PHYB activation tagged suppressor 1
MLKRWRQHDGKEIDVFQEFKLLTSEIISRTAFGSSYLEGEHVFDMLTRMGDIIVRNHYKITIPGIGYVSYISPTSSTYLCLTNLVFIYFVNLW